MTYYKYDVDSSQGQGEPAWAIRYSSTYFRHDGPPFAVHYLEYDGAPIRAASGLPVGAPGVTPAAQGTVTYSRRDGGRAATRIEEAVALHRDRLCGAASLVLGAANDGEDVVQEACLRALERADLLRSDVDPLAFVRGFVRLVAQEELRRRLARSAMILSRAVERDPTCEPHQPSTLDGLLRSEAHRYVRLAVQRLPDAQRDAVGALLDGVPAVEAASERDVSADAMRLNQARGRKALVRILRGYLDEER